jgi:nicotinamidase-related amidase
MAKIMLIVDMVKGFIENETADGSCALYIEGAKSIVPNIKREMEALSEKDHLIFLCDAHDEDDKEFESWPRHCLKDTEESEVIDELEEHQTKASTKKMFKTRFSGFFGTPLSDILEEIEVIDEVIVTGVVTEVCVFATALDARYRDYPVTIPRDCVFPLDKERGALMLSYLKQTAGVNIR